MKKKIILAVLLIFLSLVELGSLAAQGVDANPFVSKGGGTAPEGAVATSSRDLSSPIGLPPFLVDIQRNLNHLLSTLVRQVKPENGTGYNLGALCLVLLAAFAYGVFHAFGPGHGKTVVGAYFLARKARIDQGLALGYLIASIHAFVAIGLVLGIMYLLQAVFTTTFASTSYWISLVSYGLIAALGVFMLVSAIVEFASRGKRHLHFHPGHSHSHNHESHDSGHSTEHAEEQPASDSPISFRELLGLATVTAIVPCPGAVTIMVFAVTLNVAFVGALAIIALSIGMGITTSVSGIISILIRKGILSVGGTNQLRRGRLLASLFRLGGSVGLASIGVLLFLAQW